MRLLKAGWPLLVLTQFGWPILAAIHVVRRLEDKAARKRLLLPSQLPAFQRRMAAAWPHAWGFRSLVLPTTLMQADTARELEKLSDEQARGTGHVLLGHPCYIMPGQPRQPTWERLASCARCARGSYSRAVCSRYAVFRSSARAWRCCASCTRVPLTQSSPPSRAGRPSRSPAAPTGACWANSWECAAVSRAWQMPVSKTRRIDAHASSQQNTHACPLLPTPAPHLQLLCGGQPPEHHAHPGGAARPRAVCGGGHLGQARHR